MREIEIKILDIDRKKTAEKLVSLGAKKVFDGEIYAIYYDSTDNSIRKNGGMLRLRKEGGKAVITFKKDIVDTEAKVREEKETRVSDFDTMRIILESAGFSAWMEMKKDRTTYELEGVHFELDKYHDEYEYIPEFLEIEGTDIKTVYRSAGLLGFTKEDCRPWDAIEVAEYYSGRR